MPLLLLLKKQSKSAHEKGRKFSSSTEGKANECVGMQTQKKVGSNEARKTDVDVAVVCQVKTASTAAAAAAKVPIKVSHF